MLLELLFAEENIVGNRVLKLLPRGPGFLVLEVVVSDKYQLDEAMKQNVVALVVSFQRLEHRS